MIRNNNTSNSEKRTKKKHLFDCKKGTNKYIVYYEYIY